MLPNASSQESSDPSWNEKFRKFWTKRWGILIPITVIGLVKGYIIERDWNKVFATQEECIAGVGCNVYEAPLTCDGKASTGQATGHTLVSARNALSASFPACAMGEMHCSYGMVEQDFVRNMMIDGYLRHWNCWPE